MGFSVVILAAGKGTRMKSATPKVLHEICGVPMLKRVIDTAVAAGSSEVIAVLRHEKELILEYLADNAHDVKIATQSEIPGTGSAVLSALPMISQSAENVVVLSGDVPLFDTASLSELIAVHAKSGADITVVGTNLTNPYGYGRLITMDGKLVSIVEENDATSEQKAISLVNAGIYVFKQAVLRELLPQITTENAKGEMYLTDVIGLAVKAGLSLQTSIVEDSNKVSGVNDRLQLVELSKVHNRTIVEKHLENGVTILDPNTTWISDEVVIERDVVIEQGCFVTGATDIRSGAKILMGSRIDGATIGNGANVGPYAYLRPGSVLGKNSKVGAFVETKNINLGEGSKIPHLSYAGDAQIGDNTNIGAGSIFANYDGKNKHKSTVGANTRIGSKTVLVAPVTVGDEVYTGAGSIVREDIPNGSLAFSENTLTIREGYSRDRSRDYS